MVWIDYKILKCEFFGQGFSDVWEDQIKHVFDIKGKDISWNCLIRNNCTVYILALFFKNLYEKISFLTRVHKLFKLRLVRFILLL